MRGGREFDIVVYGASGFTGRLVAEYLAGRKGAATRWAMAGRDFAKLAAVRDEIGAPSDLPLIAADASNPQSLRGMAKRTRVVLTTVGPYQLYGSDLVAACAAEGTDYADLCGEPAWMRAMIDANDAKAKKTGARIVFSCGFDSIPFDLGVLTLQTEATKRFGKPFARVKGRVRKMRGTFSGGTAASLKATLAAAAKDPNIVALLKNPFALTPGFEGPKQPSGMKPEFDDDFGSWMAPFVMAAINTRNVHRTNALTGFSFGRDFVYDEMVMTGAGEKGEQIAKGMATQGSGMEGDKGPKPGEGPSREERENGFYDLVFLGVGADGRKLAASVKGDKDPGYGSTSKMIAETALALAEDDTVAGGVWTPGAALGLPLAERLQKSAGIVFAIEG
ncbi:MAG TPA: saccharopine dehydrogenase NADP-binding domain-containing protein [Beijerinckiaceae bacterium]|nr:saccharopine dehydrogenase NADP-binding domain-containing protein [Methylobacteriaceae bacterium]HRY02924.1 saccharopine dehydrogenase NADP-binding domain-containing protein [Beijerinckiaceae bacterium]